MTLPPRLVILMIIKIAWSAVKLPFSRSRVPWRQKMRACYRCPIFDRELKRCRPYSGAKLGCGCYTPFLALVEDRCFANKHHLTLRGRPIGWPTDYGKENTRKLKRTGDPP